MAPIDFQMLNDVLFGYSQSRVSGLTQDTRFAHYTSLETAVSILCGTPPGQRSFWMNNARNTNDSTEVLHGFDCLAAALADAEVGGTLRAAFDAIMPGLWEAVGAWMNQGDAQLREHTYFVSVAAHNGYEIAQGNMAMWGWYGLAEPVCFIFRPDVFVTPQSQYAMVFSPVFYGDFAAFRGQVIEFAQRLHENADRLRKIGRALLLINIKRVLAFAITSTKLQAFENEKEWRVLIAPDGYREALPSSVETIRNVPRRVFKIPLVNKGDLQGIEVDQLVERVIIGPLTPAEPARSKLIDALRAAGVTDAEKRVVRSDIPLA